MVTSVTLPSLGGRHSLTASKTLTLVQIRIGPCNLPKKIAGSDVVEQVETLLFAVVGLQGAITSVYEQKGECSTRGGK